MKHEISQKAKIKANKLHAAEHRIVEKKEATHKAEYYYYMACQLIEDVKAELKEVSKQQKYLWQTMEEAIKKLNEKEKI